MGEAQWRAYWASTVGSILVAVEFVLLVALGSGDAWWWVAVGGVGLSAGMTFFALSVIQLRRHGGESLVDPSALVQTGVYSIVRHPQYVAWLMFAVSLALIVQHWTVIAMGVVAVVLYLVDFRKVDKDEGLDKFGDVYREYMKRVPGWNPLAGVWRRIRRGGV